MRLLGLLLIALLLAAPAQAWPESAASSLRSDVLAVGHGPDVVLAGTQFEGFLLLAPGSNVTHVHYQVCVISDLACVISPRPAAYADGLWRFNTADFENPATGEGATWTAGQRIGIQWFLGTEPGLANATAFPHGTPLEDPACGPGLEKAVACYETHYFEFQIVGVQDTPGFAPVPALLVLVAVLVALRRR